MGLRTMFFDEFPLSEVGHTVLLAGVIYEGPQHTYLVPFPECGGFDSGDLAEVTLDLDEWNRLLTADGTIVKALVRKCERLIAGQVSWNVFMRDGFKCRYCGRGDAPLTVDHLVLWEEGGPSIEANLLSACKKCNKARGRMPYAEWLHSPHYLRVSRGLVGAIPTLNEELVAKLDTIPRLVKVRSR